MTALVPRTKTWFLRVELACRESVSATRSRATRSKLAERFEAGHVIDFYRDIVDG